MPSFLENAASIGIKPLPSFESSTVFPTSVSAGLLNGQESVPLESRNAVNSAGLTGAGVLGFLGNVASLVVGYKAADAALTAAKSPVTVPATAQPGASSSILTPEVKKYLIWGGIVAAVLVVIAMFRRR